MTLLSVKILMPFTCPSHSDALSKMHKTGGVTVMVGRSLRAGPVAPFPLPRRPGPLREGGSKGPSGPEQETKMRAG